MYKIAIIILYIITDVVCSAEYGNKKTGAAAATPVVREMGLEPTRHTTHAPQTCLSTNFSTLARNSSYYNMFLLFVNTFFKIYLSKNNMIFYVTDNRINIEVFKLN